MEHLLHVHHVEEVNQVLLELLPLLVVDSQHVLQVSILLVTMDCAHIALIIHMVAVDQTCLAHLVGQIHQTYLVHLILLHIHVNAYQALMEQMVTVYLVEVV